VRAAGFEAQFSWNSNVLGVCTFKCGGIAVLTVSAGRYMHAVEAGRCRLRPLGDALHGGGRFLFFIDTTFTGRLASNASVQTKSASRGAIYKSAIGNRGSGSGSGCGAVHGGISLCLRHCRGRHKAELRQSSTL